MRLHQDAHGLPMNFPADSGTPPDFEKPARPSAGVTESAGRFPSSRPINRSVRNQGLSKRLPFLAACALALALAGLAANGATNDNAIGLHSDGGGWGFRRAAVPDPTLPRVLLVGDSVMNSYRAEVTRLLAGQANVDTWATGMHLGDEHLISDLTKVLAQGPYAVVHFNIGLHDWPEGRIPAAQYEPLMQRYFGAYASSAPRAKLIWASSTPVTAKGTNTLDPQINPVIVRQNEIAARVAKAHAVPVNDLHALGVANLPLARGDQFHWTAAGARLFAGQVAREITAALGPAVAARNTEAGREELASPDGRVQLVFALGGDGEPGYRVRYRDAAVLERSRLGFLVKDGAPLTRGFRVAGVERTRRDERWRPVVGERAEVRDHFNALTVRLVDDQTPPRELRIEFRAYDEGIAFRCQFAGAGGALTVTDELSEFRFAGDHLCWPTYTAQGVYARKPLSEVKPGCERPLVVELPDGRWAAIGEAALVVFARMKLQPAGQPNALRAHLHGPATVTLPGATPWRYVLLADSPGALLERNFLRLNLNEPCAIADTAWIKPGKVIREVTLTTAGGVACVDFAARHGLQYIEFDAGWYGPENQAVDATRVALDPARSPGPLDLQHVIRHAASNGVGVILYVNKVALGRQIDTLPALYRSWGVKGIKFGFVNVGSQADTRWLHEAIRKCATNHILVDIHDEFRSTGYERTYPNLLTVEGVRGDEETPGAAQDMATLFTRMLTGPADHTVCYFEKRVTSQWNHAYQLAKAVCFYSPWQFLYWYDRPPQSPARGGAGGSLPVIRDEPELAFYDALPTVWDDTRVIQGSIGEYGAIARRRGDEWFIGVMNAGTNRTLSLPLTFLEPGRKYQAQRYSHDPALTTVTRVRLETFPVDATTDLPCILGPTDGQAMHLRPARD
jgi:alpha-glucosidase